LNHRDRQEVVLTAESIAKKMNINHAMERSANAYANYIDYARSPQKYDLYLNLDSQKGISSFMESKHAAENQLTEIYKGKFPREDLTKYYTRLFTKLLSTEILLGFQVRAFDGHEYSIGVEMLLSYGRNLFGRIDENFLFPYKSGSYDKMQRILAKLELKSSLPLLVAAIKKPDFFNDFKTALTLLPEEEIMGEAEEAKKTLLGWYNKMSISGVSFLAAVPSFPLQQITPEVLFKTGISLIISLVSFVKCIQEKGAFRNHPCYAQFLAFAVLQDSKRNMGWWVNRFCSFFRKPQKQDTLWLASQRIMGGWTDKSLYIPWFEQV